MRLLLSVGGALALGVAAFAGERLVCGGDEGDIPHEAGISGAVVRAVRGRTLVVDEATVVLPASRAQLRWICDEAAWESVDLSESFSVGDVINVQGSLRGDGSILAYSAWHPVYGADPLPTRAGIVDSVEGYHAPEDGAWTTTEFTVRGVRYRVSYEPHSSPRPFTTFLTDTDDPYTVRPVLAGDAACVAASGEDEDGVRTASVVYVHQAGEGTVVQGVVRAVDDRAYTFDVDGVTCFENYSGAAHAGAPALIEILEAGPGDEWVGMRVRVSGVLRDGVVLARRIDAIGRTAAAASSRLRGHVRGNGVLDAVDDGSVSVSGLAMERRRRARTGGVAAGTRVRFEARMRASGVVATRMRGR